MLGVISSSPGELERVFQSILEKATHICEANFGTLFRFDGKALRLVAQFGAPSDLIEAQTRLGLTMPGGLLDQVNRTKQVIHTTDRAADAIPGLAARFGAARSVVGVPMLKDDALIGAIIIYGKKFRPFTDKQIEFVKSFAAQAVIAIENARLLNELRQSLEQQTATSEVLQVISSSPGDLEPVFATMLGKAVAICNAKFGNIHRWDGEALHLVATHNTPPAFAEARRRLPNRPSPKSSVGRMIATKAVVHVVDAAEQPGYAEDRDPASVAAVELGGVRTVLYVPMLRENELVGAFTLSRQEVRAFSEEQIGLVKNFAAQAVVAIENARLLNELRQRTTDLTEALEQQTATSEVLQTISKSPGELQPVFHTMLANAVQICDAKFGNLLLFEVGAFRTVALHGAPQPYLEERQREPVIQPKPGSDLDQLVKTKQAVHVPDIREKGMASGSAIVELAGARTILTVPMVKESDLIGAIGIYRQKVRPFTDKQIELVKNFAAQAIIAIENARLLNELRARTTELTERTGDLTEALEQQTATSEVLQVISSSPGDLQPVFAAMLEKAVRVCDATFGDVYRPHGDAIQLVAMQNTSPAFAEALKQTPHFRPSSSVGVRMVATKSALQVTDLAADPDYVERRSPFIVAAVELGGVRTVLAVPMLKESELIGAFMLCRQEVRPFTDKQIELVKNFAAQAVIAIENARLLNELRQSLEQQTATSEVLQVISSSPGDLQPVFETLLRNATQLCKAKIGTLFLHEEGRLRLVAAYDLPTLSEVQAGIAHEAAPGGPLEGAIRTRKAVQIADLAATEAYKQRHPRMVEAVELGGIRTAVAVPMLKDEEVVGVIAIQRSEVVPFDDKQVALLTSFAAQAVIAIENARLLNELHHRTADLTEALEQQTATSEVLKVISSSPGELAPVFATLLAEATELCEAKFGSLFLLDGDVFNVGATYIPPSAGTQPGSRIVIGENPGIPLARILQTKQLLHIADLRTDQSYIERNARIVSLVERAGARTLLAVPMLKGAELIGAITIYRDEVRDFTDKQIGLVTNFAAQAVIALENARLLNELRERTDQLAAQSQELAQLNQQLEQRVTDQVDEIERMSRLRRFLPPQVADLIVASGSEKQLESHRREITALFCDLRGVVIRYSGTLERYAGDGVMVVFNDPVPVENPALQAVLMALELRNALGALTQTWSRLGHEIGFGIGIAHGFATLGTIGYEGRFDYAAIGTVSNVASRLCDEAKPGQILISPRVLMKVENAVKVEPVGEFVLKGIRRPLAAYNVVAALASKI